MRKKLMMLIVVLLGMMASREAQAFYNPSTGRWLNRDPYVEPWFVCLQKPASNDAGVNPYGFVANNPESVIDVLGLGWYERQCQCKKAGGQWIRNWKGYGFTSACKCANAWSLDAGIGAALGVGGTIAGGAAGYGIGLGLGANWGMAWLLCLEWDCFKNGAPINLPDLRWNDPCFKGGI